MLFLQIYIRIKDDEWNIYRRFAQFYELHKHLKKKDPIIKSFEFPQKKTFGYKVTLPAIFLSYISMKILSCKVDAEVYDLIFD